MLRQRTVRAKLTCIGVGLHSGQAIKMELLPASEDVGIVFVRADLPGQPEVPVAASQVANTDLATTLAVPGASVGTVEHLLAALMGVGIDNARIILDGPEVPILDGSAAPFVRLVQEVGIEQQRAARRFLMIRKEVVVRQGDKRARLLPASRLSITCSLDFDHPLIPPAPLNFVFSEEAFVRELAAARTFGFLQDVEALRRRGLARGGSLDNAIVIDGYKVLNPEGLRYSDEFVRHKVLDALGDMALFGMPLLGRLQLQRSGHALNCMLVQAVLADRKAFEVVQPAMQVPDTQSLAGMTPFDLLGDVAQSPA